jgi:LDH2 family malate/lactate/ureidoglycolate dehydrogenase
VSRNGVEESVAAAIIHRFRYDDLRRFAAALGSAIGLAPTRALALASHLLWFDTAGAATLGIATLPLWLEAIDAGRVDREALGRVTGERAALAHFDGQNGLPPLLLERAAELAVEKARETAVGVVRIAQVGVVRSAAAVTASMALGPTAGLVLGPSRLWSMALPSDAGLPVVFDSGLANARATGKTGAANSPGELATPLDLGSFAESLLLGAEVLLTEDGWLVAAVSVPAAEPLSTFHERVATTLKGLTETPGRLLPAEWDLHRREAREQGLALTPTAWKSLNPWAHRLAVEMPTPLGR